MSRVTMLALLVFAFATGTQAQHQHPNHTEHVIDGAKNPELIPDLTAYRLWLVTVSTTPNATAEDLNVQHAHLAKLQLIEPDRLQLIGLLTDFKVQYQNLIDRHNESVKTVPNGKQSDQKAFLQQLDDLVQSTKLTIAARLSPKAAARLDAHVMGHKKNIQLHEQVHTSNFGGNQ